jgi:hypothetical protein
MCYTCKYVLQPTLDFLQSKNKNKFILDNQILFESFGIFYILFSIKILGLRNALHNH